MELCYNRYVETAKSKKLEIKVADESTEVAVVEKKLAKKKSTEKATKEKTEKPVKSEEKSIEIVEKTEKPVEVKAEKVEGKPEKKEAEKKEPKKKSVTKAEAAEISEQADVIEGKAKPEKKPVKKPKNKATVLAVDGMVVKTKPSEKTEPEPKKAQEERLGAAFLRQLTTKEVSESGATRFSRTQSTVIAILSALVVGVVGGIIMWMVNHKDVAYCTVQFEGNGGSETASEEVVCGKKVAQPDDPTKEGFDFVDWVYEGLTFNFDRDTVKDDMILVAKWRALEGTEIVMVRFNSNGGSEVAEREIAKGTTMTAPIRPTRSGYSFAGWFVGNEEYDFTKPVNSDLTLTARWIRNETPTKPVDDKKDVLVTSLAAGAIEIEEGGVKEVTVTALPTVAKYELKAMSGNEKVVVCTLADAKKNKVSCSGVGVGETTVRVTDALSGSQTMFKVTVKQKFIPVESLTVGGGGTLTVGETRTLWATVAPENATDPTVSWSSSNRNVATVNNRGVVTAVAPGNVVISVSAGDIVRTIQVEVKAKEKPTCPEGKTCNCDDEKCEIIEEPEPKPPVCPEGKVCECNETECKVTGDKEKPTCPDGKTCNCDDEKCEVTGDKEDEGTENP